MMDGNNPLRLLVGCLVISLMVSVCVQLGTRRYFPEQPRVATVEVSTMVEGFIKDLAKQGLELDEIRRRSEIFAKAINDAAGDLGAENGMIVMPAEAVLSGRIDMTATMRALVEERLK